MTAISIIMPVYNSEQYLSQAIESILSQTFKDFELILINDGSKDNSGTICDQYAKADERIIVIHQENAGISGARNKGLSIAKGEYIAFADNDDEFSANLLEDNYSLAKKYDADIVKFGVSYYTISEKNKSKIHLRDVEFQTLLRDEIRNSYLYLKKENLLVYVWDGLFKKSLIHDNDILFNTDMRYGGEDINFNLLLFPHLNKLVINPTEYYTHYKRYSHSTVVHFNSNKLETYLINAQLEYEILNNMSLIKTDDVIWAECLSLYIIQIVFALSKIDTKLRRDKISFLRNLSLYDCYQAKYSYRNLLKLWMNNKKRALILFLYQNRFYYLLYLSIFIYSRNNI